MSSQKKWEKFVEAEEKEAFKKTVEKEEHARHLFQKTRAEADESEKLALEKIKKELSEKYKITKKDIYRKTKLDQSIQRTSDLRMLEKLGKVTATIKNPKPMRLFGRAEKERERAHKKRSSIIATANSPVNIRNIYVVQEGSKEANMIPHGEFKFASISNDKKLELIQKNESDDDVTVRMFDHVKTVADLAHKKHLEENFHNPDNFFPLAKVIAQEKIPQNAPALLKEDKKNQITRLSFPECSFYTNIDRGPLSIESFNELLDQLLELAKRYAENFHLLLATFPVLTNGEVRNISAYIQCGDKPKINLTVKAMPSPVDPVYPNTVNSYFLGGSPAKQFIKTIFIASMNLSRKTSKGTVTDNEVGDFIKLCQSNRDYEPPQELIFNLENLQNKLAAKTPLSNKQRMFDGLDIQALTGAGKYLADNFERLTKSDRNFDMLEFLQLINDDQFSPKYVALMQPIHQKLIINEDLTNQEKLTMKRVRKAFIKRKDDYLSGYNIEKEMFEELTAVGMLDFIDRFMDIPWRDDIREALKRISDVIAANNYVDPNDSVLYDEAKAYVLRNMRCNFIDEISVQADESLTSANKALSSSKLQDIERPLPGVNYEFTRHVECLTAGRAKFTTTLDICYDQATSVAKQTQERKIITAMQEGKDVHPKTISNVLTSSTITPSENSAVSYILEQVDSYKYVESKDDIVRRSGIYVSGGKEPVQMKNMLEKTELLNATHFGGVAEMSYYHPVKLSSLSGDIGQNVDLNNLIMEDYLELKLLRQNYPKLTPVYNNAIYLHILNSFMDMYTVMNGEDVVPDSKDIYDFIAETAYDDLSDIDEDLLNYLIPELKKLDAKNSVLSPLCKLISALLRNEMVEQAALKKQTLLKSEDAEKSVETRLLKEAVCTQLKEFIDLKSSEDADKSSIAQSFFKDEIESNVVMVSAATKLLRMLEGEKAVSFQKDELDVLASGALRVITKYCESTQLLPVGFLSSEDQKPGNRM